MSDIKDIPAIPQSVDGRLRASLEQMRSAVHRMRDSVVMWDELRKAGVADTLRNITLSGGGDPGPQGPPGPPGADGGAYEPDLTQPPAPASVTLQAGINTVLVSWPAATYTVGHGHGQTNIYAVKQAAGSSTLYTFVDASRVDSAPGALTIRGLASEPNVKWRVWITYQSNDGVESDPAGGVNGAVDTTGQDIAALLDVLTGEIRQSELDTALSTRINLIDGPDSLAGSVAARVKAESDARAAALAGLGAENLYWGSTLIAGPSVYGVGASIKSPTVGDPHLLQAGEWITVSADISGDAAATSGSTPARLFLYTQNGSGWTSSVYADTMSATPVRVTASLQLPATLASMEYVAVAIYHTNAGPGYAGTVKAERIQIERGRVATAYKQSIQRAVQRVVDLEATVNNPTTGVAATASALDTVEAIVTHGTSGNSALASRTAVVEASTAALQNAGGNRVSNSSFELDTDGNGVADGFVVYNNGAIAVASSLISGYVRGYAQRVDFTGTANTTTQGIIVETANPAWVPNKTYIAAFMARGFGGQVGRPIQLAWNFGPNAQITILNPPLSNNWQRYAFKLVMGATVEPSGRLHITSQTGSPARNGALDFDDITIYEGTELLPYEPGRDSGGALSAAVLTEQTARVAGDAANANSITTISARLTNGDLAQFAARQTWDFNNPSSTDGWSGYAGSAYGSVTPSQGALVGASNAAGDFILEYNLATAERFLGATADKIRARIKKPATSAQWSGFLYYSTTTRAGQVFGKHKVITEPAWDSNGWAVCEWDMATSADPAEWAAGTITGVRIDLWRDTDGPSFTGVLIDWVAIGARTAAATSAVVQQEIEARVTGDAANASAITTLQSQIAGSSGSGLLSQIQTEATTRASQTGHLGALYTVRVQLTEGGRTVMGGFGVSGTSGGTAGATIDFGVQANKFWIGAPEGSTGVSDVQPFVVQTTDVTVNGVTIPKGVYMDAAYIKNLSVLWARFGTLVADSIQATAISAAQLTLGDGTVGGNLKSTVYTGGSAGWIFRPDGYMEASNAVIRGAVYASSGTIGGSYLGTNYIMSTNWISGSTGWRFNNDGTGWIGGIYLDTTSIRSSNYIVNSQGFALRADGTGQIGGLKVNTTNVESSNYVAETSGMRINYNGDVEINNLTARGNITANSLDAATADIVNTLHIAGDAIGSNKHAVYYTTSAPTGWTQACTLTQTGYPANSKNVVFFKASFVNSSAPTRYVRVRVSCNGVVIWGPFPAEAPPMASGFPLGTYASWSFDMQSTLHQATGANPVYTLDIYSSGSDVVVDASVTLLGVKKGA